MRAFTDYDVESLAEELAGWGFKPSHAAGLMRAFYGQPAGKPLSDDTWDRDLGVGLLSKLRQSVAQRRSCLLSRHQSADGTVKLLLGMDRGGAVESVLMPAYDPSRAAACVSSQIGCAMGCDFCASTRHGLERDLEPGEIVEQFLSLRDEAARTGRRLTSLVFMGMGEPMHNLDNVIAAIRRIADPRMGGLGWRQVTVSTVGIVPGIDQLAEADLNVHLAVSLHAPDDDTRRRIIPTGKRWTVAEIISAARRFEAATRRVPTIEYTLLAGVNDSDEQAMLLAGLLGGFRAHVNLIPYNWIGPGLGGRVYQRPARDRIYRFLEILRQRRVVAHIRRTRGDDVNAACGQLRETATTTTATTTDTRPCAGASPTR
jgi:23S rRNA (adenine2503-C2)-methyltransferase